MAVVISSIVLLGLYLIYDVNQATFIRGEQQTDLQQNARIGMDRIVRELRLAGYDPQSDESGLPDPIIPDPCATAIQSATATSVSFIADIDSDGTTEKVEYTHDPACNPNCAADPPKIRREEWPSLAGTNCTANWSASGGAQPFAERVTALTFVFYDGGTPLATPLPASSLDTVRRIAVTITTADTVTGSVPQPYTLRAEIRPRNLGLNP
jgi:type IV pilus assembly protein PilW